MHRPTGHIWVSGRSSVAQPAIREAIFTTLSMTSSVGPQGGEEFRIESVDVLNAVKDTLLLCFVEGLTFPAVLNAPDLRGTVPPTRFPDVLKPGLLRDFQLKRFVIDAARERGAVTTEGQGSEPATIDHGDSSTASHIRDVGSLGASART